MTPEEFQMAKLDELALITGVAKSRWSQYFNSKMTLSERTLNRAAVALEMTPSQLLDAINRRRNKR